MKRVPVCLSFDDNYAGFGCTVIKSVLDHACKSDLYVFYILHENLSTPVIDKLKGFIASHNSCEIHFIDVKPVFEKINLFHHTIYNRNTYYRLAICDILPDESKVIYLDSDIIVNSDLSDLYQYNMGGAMIAAAQDVFIHCLLQTHGLTNGIVGTQSIKAYFQKELNIAPEENYYQAGILLMDLEKIRSTNLPAKAIELAGSKKYWMQDQDIINKVYKGNITELPQLWNVLTGDGYFECFMSKISTSLVYEYKEARNAPLIVHFAGKTKPWIYFNIDYAALFWSFFRRTPWSDDTYDYLISSKLRSTSDLPYGKSWKSIFQYIIEKMFGKGTLRRDSLIYLLRKFKTFD